MYTFRLCGCWFGCMVGALKQNWKTGDMELEKRCIFSIVSKNKKIFVFQVDAHERVISVIKLSPQSPNYSDFP